MMKLKYHGSAIITCCSALLVWYPLRVARESTARDEIDQGIDAVRQLRGFGNMVSYICLSIRTGYPGLILSLRSLTFLIQMEC